MGDELLNEVLTKRAELGGASVPMERAIEALLLAAGATWQLTLLRSHRNGLAEYFAVHDGNAEYRASYDHCATHDQFHPGQSLHPGKGFQRNDWTQLELRPGERALCVVAGQLRPLIKPVARTGIGADAELCWRLLWLDAVGVNAPGIAKTLQPRKPPHRDRIWKLRKALYSQLAATLTAQSQEHIAEAA